MAAETAQPTFEIPKTCKAGVVNDMGPNFYLTVEDVPVPEIGMSTCSLPPSVAD